MKKRRGMALLSALLLALLPCAAFPGAAAEEAESSQAEESAPAETQAEGPARATVSFLGDCSIGDTAQHENYKSSYHTVLAEKGYAWPFSLVKSYLEADDLTVANLEVVLTTRNQHKNKVYYLRGKPEFAQVLTLGSVEAVNTVNNHCEDFGKAGYQDTLDSLDAEGILRFGCLRPDLQSGHDDLLIQDLNGIRFGFIGFTYPQNDDVNRIEKRVKKLKEEEGCDVVIVSLHWGREEHDTPTSGQMSYAKKVINAGADMIFGHHPHVLQQIHFYEGKPILYSTGNFTFGTMSRVDPSTGIFQLTWEKSGEGTELKKLQVIPCETTRSPDFRPFPLEDEEACRAVFAKLRFKKENAGFVNLPESFLETGIAELKNGDFVQTVLDEE